MNCPLCATPLEAVERQGIELDHCPSCGGMWLDAGELSALLEREAVAALRQGERALSAQRHGKEFDSAVYDTAGDGGRVGTIAPGYGVHFVLSNGRTGGTMDTIIETLSAEPEVARR